jgi:hypothetical protein
MHAPTLWTKPAFRSDQAVPRPVLGPRPLPVRAAAYLGYLLLVIAVSWVVQRRLADPIARALRRQSSHTAASHPPPLPQRV